MAIACLPAHGADLTDLTGLSARLPELRQQLLLWWDQNGRHTIPWKRLADGRMPGPGEPLDPYPIWIAEANRG